MKDRILGYLNDFAKGADDSLAAELKRDLKQDEVTFRQNCAELQSEILHHYDQFSISTIDAFFQKVIRSFTRESGLMGDYRLEVDTNAVLEEVINNLIDELGDKPELTKWVVEFAQDSLLNERAWDVRKSLGKFAEEIFREEFKAIEGNVKLDSASPEFFRHLREELSKIKNSFLAAASKPATEVLNIIVAKGWQTSDFKFGSNSGITGFFNQYAFNKSLSSYDKPGARMRNDFTLANNWPSKTSQNPTDIVQTAEQKFIPHLNTLLDLYDKHYPRALSAEVALKNMYVFGLLADIARKLHEYKAENNVMLLADAPQLLNGIIGDSDTPFIYEKIGSFYHHYLIDEFQDTSGMQWKNFLPLLTNGLDQGYPSLVVGDVKQAIYRWRGGDLNLLEQEVENKIGKERVEIQELDKNFRSARNIVRFNNDLFETTSQLVSAEVGSALPATAYRDVSQLESIDQDGFVRISFLTSTEDEHWTKQSLDQIPHHLESLQLQGVALSDIAILVRQNYEGHEVASHLLQYRNSEHALANCRYDVVSNDSLRIDGAASVNLLLGAMRYLLNPEDPVARAQLSFEFARIHEPDRSEVDVFAVSNQVFFESQLPEAFTKEKLSLKKLPLFELTETLISIFRLGNEIGELSYLLAFQDLVLNFYSRERNDLASFFEWWEMNRGKEIASIKISGEVDAVKILTIHKAKGLQFKYVLIPFCSWNVDQTNFHAPNLWVRSEQAPFADAGYLPVKYSSKLAETYFHEAYHEERTRTYLDNLNLLYVAFTRAELGMIITAPPPGKTKAGGTVARWLHQSIKQNENLMTCWNEASQEFVRGDWHRVPAEPKEKFTEGIQLQSYPSSRWRDKLVIRQAGTTFFECIKSDQRNKINYGIHLHAVLSRIQFAGEIPLTLEKLVQDGLILTEEKSIIQQQLDELMAHPLVGPWFSSGWKVRTEASILLPGGVWSRIDRLITKDGKAIVIDFKTGEKSKADQKQVSEYIQILQKMNFIEVEGYLLYTHDQEVISVSEGKMKVVKKKNERQLGLGF